MSYYEGPEQLAEWPPERWTVERRQYGTKSRWDLMIDDSGIPIRSFDTKREATNEKTNPQSYTRLKVEQERLWYEGVTPTGWKTYEQCKSEQRRTYARRSN